ncbi:phage major capsid protein [Brucella sp. 22210]|uniref:phage major capsid protein n=1 Tax=Brucella sp. 22210 TaxID=3453892 RepID=UPI003F875CFB
MEKLEIKADVSIDDAGTVTGIAWPFGKPDSIGDLIEPTAFKFAPEIPMLVEHDGGQVVGVWKSYAVTDKGLEVKGRLFVEGSEPARLARQHLKARSMSGLSIGYMNNGFKARPEGGRVLTDITVAEISLCRRPIHPNAGIIEVKSAVDGAAFHTQKDNFSMENEAIEIVPEAKADPVIDQKSFDAMKARLDKLEAKANRPQPSNNNHPRAMNDNGDLERKAFTDYVRTGRIEEKALAYGEPSTGGVLAPGETAKTILEKLAEYSPLRSLASSMSMSIPVLEYPRLVDEVEPGEVGETDDRPESETSYDTIDLRTFETAVTVPVTRILLEDAQIDLESFLSSHIARRFGQREARHFIVGDGKKQAEGVLISPDVLELEADQIDGDVLIDLFSNIKTGYSRRGAWLMNRATMATVRKLKATDGSYIWQHSIAADVPPTLLGRPVYEAVDMPNAEAGKSPIVFGDFQSGYMIADRAGFSTIRDELTGADQGIIKLRARRRVGGRVIQGEAITKLKIVM